MRTGGDITLATEGITFSLRSDTRRSDIGRVGLLTTTSIAIAIAIAAVAVAASISTAVTAAVTSPVPTFRVGLSTEINLWQLIDQHRCNSQPQYC